MLVHEARLAENRGLQFLGRVDRDTAAREHEALHVAPLGAAQGQDAGLGQGVEGGGVDALLVDQQEALPGRAHLFFEGDDRRDARVGRSALSGHEALALVGGGIEKAGRDLGPLKLEADVRSQHKDFPLHPFGHVRVARAVIQDQAAHETGVSVQLVAHVHDLVGGAEGWWAEARARARRSHFFPPLLSSLLTSTICRSIGSPSRRTVSTASATMEARASAIGSASFVRSAQRAAQCRASRSAGEGRATL